MGRQAASFHYRRRSRASHVQYNIYSTSFSQDGLLASVVTIFIYCTVYTVYTVQYIYSIQYIQYILYIHGALARQMKMFWNRSASSQLCEQYITHVYVQYIYTVCIYGALARTNNTFELQNDVTLRLFPERSFSKFSGLYASLTVQYMNSKLQTPNYHMF